MNDPTIQDMAKDAFSTGLTTASKLALERQKQENEFGLKLAIERKCPTGTDRIKAQTGTDRKCPTRTDRKSDRQKMPNGNRQIARQGQIEKERQQIERQQIERQQIERQQIWSMPLREQYPSEYNIGQEMAQSSDSNMLTIKALNERKFEKQEASEERVILTRVFDQLKLSPEQCAIFIGFIYNTTQENKNNFYESLNNDQRADYVKLILYTASQQAHQQTGQQSGGGQYSDTSSESSDVSSLNLEDLIILRIPKVQIYLT